MYFKSDMKNFAKLLPVPYCEIVTAVLIATTSPSLRTSERPRRRAREWSAGERLADSSCVPAVPPAPGPPDNY